MRKLFSIILSISLVFSAFSAIPLTASAEGGALTQTFDFSDSSQLNNFFTTGPDNGRWGNWEIANGKLQVTGNPVASWWGTSLMTESTYGDFTMEFDADVSAAYGIILRAQDDGTNPGAGLNAWWGGNGYEIVHWAPVESNASAAIYNLTGSENMLHGMGAIGAMTHAHWLVCAEGNEIYVKISNADNPSSFLEYTLVDNSYASGHIGFYNLTAEGVTSLKVDNLVITGNKVYDAEKEVVWNDTFGAETGGCYTAYGLWWNNYNSFITDTSYNSVVGNESIEGGWAYYYLKGIEMSDFSAEFDVVSSKSPSYGMMVRAGNPCDDADGGNGYAIMYDGNWSFVGALDGAWDQVIDSETGAYAYNPGNNGVTVHHWRVVGEDDQIKVYFNRSHVAAYTVCDDRYDVGYIGFRVLSDSNTVENLIIDNLYIKGIRMGDVNEDGNIDIADFVRMKKHLADNTTAIHTKAAELNGDNNIDIDDMIRLRKYLLGAISSVYEYI